MKKRNPIIEIILVIVILILVNLIASKLLFRVDLTSSKRYTLSPDTKELISSLDNELQIEFYVSREIPSYIASTKKEILGMLSEYEIASHGKITVREINPDKPEMEKKLMMYGIQPVNLNIRQRDKYEIARIFLAIAVFYKERVESIPVVPGIKDLEYNLTSIILKAVSENVPVIGYPQNNPDFEFQKVSGFLSEELSKQYKVVPIDLKRKDWLENTDMLLLPGLRRDLSDEELFNVDQYLLKGGNIAAFLNGVNISYEGESEINSSNIIDFLKHNSITLEPKLIADISNELMPYSDGQRNLIAPYPLWVKVLNDTMNPRYEFLKEIPSMVFAWTSPVKLSSGGSLSYEILINSSNQAWTVGRPFIIHPSMVRPPATDVFSQYILSGIEKGVFDSYFKEKELPANAQDAPLMEGIEEGKIWITGNPYMLQDSYLRRFSNNKVFILNVMDHILLGDRLGSVRSKTVEELPVPEMEQGRKTAIKVINYVLMPVLVMIYGIIRFIRRKKKTSSVKESKK